jgi:hypothetical protein
MSLSLGSLSRWALGAAGLLVLVWGGRMLFVAVEKAPPPRALPAVSEQPVPQLSDLRNLPVVDLSGGALRGLNAEQPVDVPREEPALLFVLTEGERRDVLLDGMALGQSPYMGQVYCKRGSTLKVVLRDKGGAEKAFERRCAPEIRVAD